MVFGATAEAIAMMGTTDKRHCEAKLLQVERDLMIRRPVLKQNLALNWKRKMLPQIHRGCARTRSNAV
jgi:hypothetical protein